MQLLSRRTLMQFAESHADARQALADLAGMIEAARWTDAAQLKNTSLFAARPIGNKRVVFEVKGNQYRVIVTVQYAGDSPGQNGRVLINFVGTHAEYNRIDAETVNQHPS